MKDKDKEQQKITHLKNAYDGPRHTRGRFEPDLKPRSCGSGYMGESR